MDRSHDGSPAGIVVGGAYSALAGIVAARRLPIQN